jgi:hypothetical protein
MWAVSASTLSLQHSSQTVMPFSLGRDPPSKRGLNGRPQEHNSGFGGFCRSASHSLVVGKLFITVISLAS